MSRRGLPVLSLLLAGCSGGGLGSGEVSGTFFVRDCNVGDDRPLSPYHFEASYLATRRLNENLEVLIAKYAADLEETDVLLVLIPDVVPLLVDQSRPLVRPISRAGTDLQLALSLFQTCPNRPTLHGIQGRVSFDKFDIEADPKKSGAQETLAGTLTATVVGADANEVVGTVRAEFDFIPERAPLTLQ